ncbi:hypothetical protein LJR029_000912 [Caballeronia sp. LjRoot29]
MDNEKAKPSLPTMRGRAAAKKPESDRSVLVRMYNVGFGDCFLIESSGEDGAIRRVLIDCGSIASPLPLSISDTVDTILADVTGEDGVPAIDVVVCTHRHADHVSGFARPEWKNLRVKEVWFPWTEDPKDQEARRVRENQSRLAVALDHLWRNRLGNNNDASDVRRWLEMSRNALSNASAMSMLHSGFRSKPVTRFLSSEGSPVPIETGVLSPMTAYVLGPSRNDDIIRDMDPPEGKTFLRQIAMTSGTTDAFEPFTDNWLIDPASFSWPDLLVDASDIEKLRGASTAWDPNVTVALEQAVNGTSLVIAFEIGDAVLFFPGDAQWGTWNLFMNNPESLKLLTRAKFWKVGHHGSHNATPKEFVQEMVPSSCCAMLSTRTGKFSSIPRLPLLDAIKRKGIALARSDEAAQVPKSSFCGSNSIIETLIPIGSAP